LAQGTITFVPTAATPEPSSIALMLVGTACLLALKRKRHSPGLEQQAS
jgi:hypothetical protein